MTGKGFSPYLGLIQPDRTGSPGDAARASFVIRAFFTLGGHKKHQVGSDQKQINRQQPPGGLNHPVDRENRDHQNHYLSRSGIFIKKLLVKHALGIKDPGEDVAQVDPKQSRAVFSTVRTTNATASLENISQQIKEYQQG